MVIPELKHGPDALARRHGDTGRAMLRETLAAYAFVRDLVANEAIACDWRECGGLLLAHHPRQVPALRQAAGEWVAAGQPVRVARRRRPRVGDRLGRVRRRAADGTDGRGAAGEAPRRPRRAGPRRGRRGTPPHAGDAPRATRSGVPRPDRARHHHRGRRPRGRERLRRRRAPGPRAARAAVGELHHRHRAPRARAGAIGDAGRPDVLRHQAPPELLAPVTRPADGVRRPRVARGDGRRRRPRRALRRDGARAPAAAGRHGHTRVGWQRGGHTRSAPTCRPAGRRRVRHRVQRHRHRARPRGSGSAPRPG